MHRVEFQEGVALLNTCHSLYVHDIREVQELTLRVRVVEASAQEPSTEAPIDAPAGTEHLFIGTRPIMADNNSRAFELLFSANNIVSYTVLNESYGRYPESPETFTGKLFREFQTSHLLEFVRKTSYACDEYPEPLHHFELACENHVVDVIATEPPNIAVGNWVDVKRDESWRTIRDYSSKAGV